MTYKNIYPSFGRIFPWSVDKIQFLKRYPNKNIEKYFIQWNFVVICNKRLMESRRIADMDLNARITVATVSELAKYGYVLIFENKDFLIYQYRGDKQ